jgi:hypothetical protein
LGVILLGRPQSAGGALLLASAGSSVEIDVVDAAPHAGAWIETIWTWSRVSDKVPLSTGFALRNFGRGRFTFPLSQLRPIYECLTIRSEVHMPGVTALPVLSTAPDFVRWNSCASVSWYKSTPPLW